MAKHQRTASGLKITKTGRIMYHTPYRPDDPNHIMSKRGTDCQIGDKIWRWSYGSRMSKNSVGIITAINNDGNYSTFTVQTLSGTVDDREFFLEDTIKLTDDEYEDIKNA